jgi:Arc/MetJ-type ribon-helix-helix transcriptional regulator
VNRFHKLSVNLPSEQHAQIQRVVDGGEFVSPAAVVREAVRVWLHRRALQAGAHGAQRFSRRLEARHDLAHAEPAERVELLFDAGDAKA